ncbi:MAG TPA: HlyD family efflux transporter periplasmic adaptor subunit [Woeseiaceae bacterium]|nr:HlyD family efflux transporter periplasmic adaptor subunit [Woeseiaceae bacterium]
MNGRGESLFRREALHARRQSWLGGISLAQPLRFWLFAVFACTAAVAVVSLLFFGEYTRRSRVPGQLVPDLGLITVAAPADGVVAGPVPQEGRQLERGEPVAIIATPRATSGNGDVTAGLLERLRRRQDAVRQSFASQLQLLEIQADGDTAQLAAARLQLEQIDASIAIARKQAGIAGELLSQVERLAAQGHVTRREWTQQEQAALERTAAVQALERQAISVRREILRIEQGLAEAASSRRALMAARARELAQLDQERLQIQAGGEVLVTAPLAGLVASVLIENGRTVRAGQPLMTLLPLGSVLQARLLVPSRAVGFIEPGDEVLLRYQAYPHQKFGHHSGRVIRVSGSALDAGALAALTGRSAAVEPMYRVLVELGAQSIVAFGESQPLRPGMAVEADILGERRKLYEWVLEPLYSVAGRL